GEFGPWLRMFRNARVCDHDVLASNNNNDTNETKIMPATVNEHIKHEIINSNTSMDNNSPAEGSNDSCSGESNLTKSNNYGLGYVTKHLKRFSTSAIRNWSRSISIKRRNRRNSGNIISGTSPNRQEYGKSDKRWLYSDSTVLSIEILTFLFCGPLSLYVLYLLTISNSTNNITKEHEASSTTQFSNISSTSINPSNNSYNPSSNNSSIPTSLEAASPNNFKPTTIICGSIIIASLSYFLSKTSSLSLSSSLKKNQQIEEEVNFLESKVYSTSLVNRLLNDPSYIHNMGYDILKPDRKTKHLTANTLQGKGKFIMRPIVFYSSEKMESIMFLHVGNDLCGHDGVIHGGLLSTIMDEGLTITVIPSLPDKNGATAFLHVNFRKPCKANQILVCKCKVTKIEGRKGFVEGRLETFDEGVVLVDANALFISDFDKDDEGDKGDNTGDVDKNDGVFGFYFEF
ncbi:12673_t:CDS:2, partial [Entrophospora sp. SA101]